MTASNGQFNRFRRWSIFGAALLFLVAGSVTGALAQAVPGGTLNPLTIPKYVTPLVIPPVMKSTLVDTTTGANLNDDYDIAVRQFQQQILPAPLPPTTVWSYGPAADPVPAVAPAANSQFNYPAYTIENKVNTQTTVNWMNELVAIDPATGFPFPSGSANRTFLSHITPIDRSLHWANPEQLTCMDPAKTKDCRPAATNGAILQQPYLGPVPIVTHVHGAHVGPESDGYPEAWWLPNAFNIDPLIYATTGTLVNQYGTLTNNAPGVASFSYPNDQPSTTLWYHDHTLGMTRNNVYAGPAGFWLIRETGGGETGLVSGTLPGPAPVSGQAVLDLNVPGNTVRAAIREIPIVIQDRSFNTDGSLFYPADRAFFEGLTPAQLQIPFIGDTTTSSDISPIWNPEAFFNVMVVNGVSWPELEVAPAIYRFRLLNGCNSRFLNLALFEVGNSGKVKQGKEIPIFQIGAEQSLLPQVVMIQTGFATPLVPGAPLPKNKSTMVPAPFAAQALLMGLAERADVLVDFRGLKNGTIVRMINTAPDAPFGGFPDVPADPATTGQVMQFRVNSALLGSSPTDLTATAPQNLTLSLPDSLDPANGPAIPGARDLALIEEESAFVCVNINAVTGVITQDPNAEVDLAVPGQCLVTATGAIAASVPFAPKAAVLGTSGSTATPVVTLWSDPIVTNPGVGDTETWELWNHTVDGHPIHLHLVKFKVVNRQVFDPLTGALVGPVMAPTPTEAGWKDTVIAYPGEVTRLNATFDIAGLYVWHCHIVEHEDNEMMVPYVVGTPGADFGDPNGTIGGLF